MIDAIIDVFEGDGFANELEITGGRPDTEEFELAIVSVLADLVRERWRERIAEREVLRQEVTSNAHRET